MSLINNFIGEKRPKLLEKTKSYASEIHDAFKKLDELNKLLCAEKQVKRFGWSSLKSDFNGAFDKPLVILFNEDGEPVCAYFEDDEH